MRAANRVSAGLLTLLLILLIPWSPGRFGTAAAAGAGIQLIADQAGARHGDTVTLHILYHNAEDRTLSQAAVNLRIPEGLTIVEAAGAEWSAETRQLTWNLTDVQANAATVLHARLKVGSETPPGTSLTLTSSLDVMGVIGISLSSATLTIGPETHQPFFIGFPDGTFRPGAPLTRAEAAAIVARIKQLPGPLPPVQGFKDVPPDHWAYQYIRRVTGAGFMNGRSGGFEPDAPLSRAELVVLLLRLRGVTPIPLQGFADSEDHWAAAAIGTARGLLWVDGTGLGSFDPDGPTERQVAAKLFAIALFRRSLSDGETAVVQHFPDVPPSLWSFGWVEEVSMVAHEAAHGLTGESLIRYRPEETHPL